MSNIYNFLPKAPDTLDEKILEFCKSISKEQPVYLSVEKESDSVVNDCYINVESKVKRDGGSIQYGWQVWITEPYLIEAEFHAVWVDTNGTMHDITQKELPTNKILFVPDNIKAYEDVQVDNIRKSLVNDKLVTSLIQLSEERFSILNKGELAHMHGQLSIEDLGMKNFLRLQQIEEEKEKTSMALINKYHNSTGRSINLSRKIGRNDPCPCGKTKENGDPVKYKKCHGA